MFARIAATLLAAQPSSATRTAAPLVAVVAIMILFGRRKVSPPVRIVGLVLALALLGFTLSRWLQPMAAALRPR